MSHFYIYMSIHVTSRPEVWSGAASQDNYQDKLSSSNYTSVPELLLGWYPGIFPSWCCSTRNKVCKRSLGYRSYVPLVPMCIFSGALYFTIQTVVTLLLYLLIIGCVFPFLCLLFPRQLPHISHIPNTLTSLYISHHSWFMVYDKPLRGWGQWCSNCSLFWNNVLFFDEESTLLALGRIL